MEELKKVESDLYNAIFGTPIVGDAVAIWDSIKSNDDILKKAIEVEKDKFRKRNSVKGLTICNCMLIEYKNVNQEIYQELVNLIYSNTDIARTVLDGYSNGGFSYLLMTLWNHDLVLTEEQKQFAVSEAMNKKGTIYYEKGQRDLEKKLIEMGIIDEKTMILDVDSYKHPVGAETETLYMNGMFTSLSSTQAHGGSSPFDIRYQILRNPNWTIQEKKKLVNDFWYDQEEYSEALQQWEWAIINDEANYNGESMPQLDRCELYDYTYLYLLSFYGDKDVTNRIWNEIKFCRTMHILRPQKWEKEFSNQKIITKNKESRNK